MREDDGAFETDAELLDRIRETVRAKPTTDLVDVDTDGPSVTAVLDRFDADDDGERLERALYEIHEEPSVDVRDDERPVSGESRLRWTYLGPVQDRESAAPDD